MCEFVNLLLVVCYWLLASCYLLFVVCCFCLCFVLFVRVCVFACLLACMLLQHVTQRRAREVPDDTTRASTATGRRESPSTLLAFACLHALHGWARPTRNCWRSPVNASLRLASWAKHPTQQLSKRSCRRRALSTHHPRRFAHGSSVLHAACLRPLGVYRSPC